MACPQGESTTRENLGHDLHFRLSRPISANSKTCKLFCFRRFVKLRYDLGKGVGEAKSNSTVTLNTWHTVNVDRTYTSGNLIVNGGIPVRVTSPGSDVALDVDSNFYLGGVRKLSNVNPSAVDNDPAFVQDFTGCIDHFEVCVSCSVLQLRSKTMDQSGHLPVTTNVNNTINQKELRAKSGGGGAYLLGCS